MTTTAPHVHAFQTLTKDLGVALVVLVALALGAGIGQVVVNRSKVFQAADAPFRLEYPARWTNVESLQDVLLKVEDPAANSPFKTSLVVETRELDPSAPPTMQTLIDRRVEQRGALTAYHFISERTTTIDGMPTQELQYSYVVQPIDTPRRASLPVVVIARDYIVLTPTRVYYVTLNAPESEFASASERMDRILESVQVQ
jgi:hypothetical protein